MLRETENVYEFNAQFKLSRGIPSLLQKSNRLDPDDAFSWEKEHYDRAKAAIEPSGQGLGKDFLRRFLPPNSVANNNTLQTAITAYYQEEWKREGEKLTEQSRLAAIVICLFNQENRAPGSGRQRVQRFRDVVLAL